MKILPATLITISLLCAQACVAADSKIPLIDIGGAFIALRPAGEASLRLPYFSNLPLDESHTWIDRAVVMVHGTLRNADDYYADILEAAQSADDAQGHTFLIAPQFLNETDQNVHGLPEDILFWEDEGWRRGDWSLDTVQHPRPWTISSYGVLDSILYRLAIHHPNLEQIVVAGHSAGGQFVNRYAAASPMPATIEGLLDATVRFVISNPSSYVYLDEKRWVPGTGWEFSVPTADQVAACPQYNDYKWGLENPNGYMDVDIDLIRQQYKAKDAIYFLGELDDNPNDYYLDTDCMDRMQGLHRIQRGVVYTRYLADLFGSEVLHRHRLVIVPGVGHDHHGMFTSPCGLLHLFDYGDCGDYPLSLTWVDITSESTRIDCVVAAWGDFDQDGRIDLLTTGGLHDPRVRLHRNEGAGTFSNATGGIPGSLVGYQNVAWADYDSDGDLDFFALGGVDPSALLRNEGDGSFRTVTPAVLAFADPAAESLSWIDYDGDGDLDLYVGWSSAVHGDALFRNDGDDLFVDATVPPLDAQRRTLSSNWADYDSDGDPDLYVAGKGTSRLLRNEGGGSFHDVTSGDLVDPDSIRCGIWGDYDNDGDPDLYLAHCSGVNRLMRNDGGDLFTDVTSGALADSGECTGAAWVDVDLDGDLDLHLTNRDSDVRMILNRGEGSFAQGGPAYPFMKSESWQPNGAAWSDCDNDGDLDLHQVDRDAWNRGNQLIINAGERGNHWLQIDLVGSLSNATGVGARIRLVADGVVQIREVGDGDCGPNAQGSLTVEFGLGRSAYADTLQIRWPRGTRQEFTYVGGDRRITIGEEDEPSGLLGEPEKNNFCIYPTYPNPLRGQATVTFAIPRPARVGLFVYDNRGRKVRTLVDGAMMPAGGHEFAWDRRDESGREVAAGIYFLHLDWGGEGATGRVIALK